MVFQSKIDTEVIPHLLDAELLQMLPKWQGAYALGVIWDKPPGALVRSQSMTGLTSQVRINAYYTT